MAQRAISWMIVDKWKGCAPNCTELTTSVFEEYSLGFVLRKFYDGSPWKALQDTGYLQLMPWETKKAPRGFWHGQQGRSNANVATKWLIEEKLQIPLQDVPKTISYRHFQMYGLGNMLKVVFRGSPYEAVEAVYPNTFHPWEFCCVGNGFWQGEAGAVHAKEAIRWLIFDVLHLEREEIPSKLHIETFRSFGLGGMLSIRFQNNISKALNFAFPGQFMTMESLQAKNTVEPPTPAPQ